MNKKGLKKEGNELDQFKNKIICGDCIENLKKLPSNCVNLIFADPPYNLQLNGELYRPNQTKVDAVNDDWDKFSSFKNYDTFTYEWLKECHRVLNNDGTIWVIGSYHNIFRVGKIMQDIGFWVLNDIIWVKTNPMPNFKGTRFNNAHETIIWASKTRKSKYTFNYKSMKSFNDDKQMRSDWNIPICLGKERLRNNGKKLHSTQKPEELLYRIILSTSKKGDLILDPFMGSGTTGAVAKMLGRDFIGFEKEGPYIEAAEERILKIKPLTHELLSLKIDEKKPKVPFGNLIEKGIILPGTNLYSKNKEYSAIVLANGTLLWKNIGGSIHKVSAEILNKSSNNGWLYWYIDDGIQLKVIDSLRDQYIKRFIN